MPDRDTLFQQDSLTGAFSFDARVATVFNDMISRSVPGYATIIGMIATLAERYAQPGTRCYDLGCSLGGSSLALREGIRVPGCRIVAVDTSQPMLDRFAETLQASPGEVPVELLCADAMDTPIEDASIVVLNFTMQFIPLEQRGELMKRIAAGLRPGGLLILSEKIRFEDAALDELFVDLHHRFKEQNGYSRDEINRKRAALENVLLPETLRAHERRVLDSGFSRFAVWFQCFNFASMVAVK